MKKLFMFFLFVYSLTPTTHLNSLVLSSNDSRSKIFNLKNCLILGGCLTSILLYKYYYKYHKAIHKSDPLPKKSRQERRRDKRNEDKRAEKEAKKEWQRKRAKTLGRKKNN